MDENLIREGYTLIDTETGFSTLSSAFTCAADARHLPCFNKDVDKLRIRYDDEKMEYLVEHYMKKS